jgi:predicted DNA-binding transcriptional regulator AlpA
MNKQQRVIKTIEDLPEVLEATHIQEFLKISKSAAYDLMKSKQFHVFKIGRLMKAPKEAFVEWVEGKKPSKTAATQSHETTTTQLQKPETCHASALYSLLEKGITLTLKIEAKK